MGGAQYLEEDTVPVDLLNEFIIQVVEATINNITRRVSMDGYSKVRLAMESPSWAPVWRYDVYPDYKHALIQEKPRVAAALQKPIIEYAEAAGLPTVFSAGYEADDVIASMVELVKTNEDLDVYIWSQDKDLHQLLTYEGIYMVGKEGKLTDYLDVHLQWGMAAEAVPLIKALSGDKSDNIPGLKGIGAKTAAKMLVPRPYRKPTPFWLDVDNLGKKKKEVVRMIPLIHKNERLCLLRKNIKLQSGRDYGQEESRS